MKKSTFIISIIFIFLLTVPVGAKNKVIFEMEDPIGDAIGDGKYTHPTLEEFGDRSREMLDLTNFRVTNRGKDIEFRLSFALEPDYVRPWDGEGFNLHRIDIYLVTDAGEGRTETFREGANVQFSTPWNKVIRVVDWNQSKIFTASDNPSDPQSGVGIGEDFSVIVDNKDIVITVSKDIIGQVDETTQYYVLVGYQDGLGLDQYRPVREIATEYVGGGGHEYDINPNIYDILADTAQEQYDQLGSWETDQLATLKPVGGTGNGGSKFFIMGATIILLLGLFIFIKRRR